VKRIVACALLCAGLGLGCVQTQGDVPVVPPPSTFSGERAFEHLSQLVALGPRVAGTAQAAEARSYVRSQLEGLGFTVHEEGFRWAPGPGLPERELVNLWVEQPGVMSGLFGVATPLDTHPDAGPGANEGGSGAALLLELARALHETPLIYSVRLMFLDAELLDAKTPFLGSEQMHHDLDSAGALAQLHALVYVHQVADRELEIRRDRNSDRSLRDPFFDVARREGLSAAFPRTAPFDDAKLGHGVFVGHRFPRVIVLADLRYGGPDVPGSLWRTPSDDLSACSATSLDAAGRVVLGGLRALAARQLEVDRAKGAALPGEGGHP
jgi:hypothetical protein